MLSTKLKEAAGNGADATLYVDDVFSTYLYTGTGATQTITNGIDLAGKGGLVWIKSRSTDATYGGAHQLIDTARGLTASSGSSVLATDIADSSSGSNGYSAANQGFASFNAAGFSLNTVAATVYNGSTNTNNVTYASWTFRKAAKFFDVVTWTGNGSTDRVLSHSLGVTPGMIVVKCTSNAGSWYVWQRTYASLTNGFLMLNATNAYNTSPAVWGSTPQSASTFTVSSNGNMNSTGATYVAYLFAHDTSSTGIVQCGTFTTDASGNATVNLGWEPQYLMNKKSSNIDNWQIYDQMRGFNATVATSALLRANIVDEEYVGVDIHPTATGFNTVGFAVSSTYIYMAIRRPNKPPTTGTQVYNANTAGTAEANTAKVGFYSGFPVDMVIYRENKTNAANDTKLYDRLRGSGRDIRTNTTGTEGASTFPLDASLGVWNTALATDINKLAWMFKRAPGFMDVVCYTGNGTSGTAITHNLGAIPELVIVKSRSAVTNWPVCCNISSTANTIYLNLTNQANVQTTRFPSLPTSTTFVIGNDNSVNTNAATYVAYLFATLAGISKVGSYTGNGTTQTINCGFTGGARFVLIKRTDSTGDWYTFDSARGLTSSSSPYLLLNSTAAEVTGNNGVYASTGGFTLGSTASTTTNINGASYIYLSVA